MIFVFSACVGKELIVVTTANNIATTAEANPHSRERHFNSEHLRASVMKSVKVPIAESAANETISTNCEK